MKALDIALSQKMCVHIVCGEDIVPARGRLVRMLQLSFIGELSCKYPGKCV